MEVDSNDMDIETEHHSSGGHGRFGGGALDLLAAANNNGQGTAAYFDFVDGSDGGGDDVDMMMATDGEDDLGSGGLPTELPELIVRRGNIFFLDAAERPQFFMARCGTLRSLIARDGFAVGTRTISRDDGADEPSNRCGVPGDLPLRWESRSCTEIGSDPACQQAPSPQHRWGVQVPADAGVGVHLVRSGGEEREFIVLFRPDELAWPHAEAAAMSELVNGDQTLTYQGDWNDFTANSWDVAPHDKLNLVAALHLLRDLSYEARQHAHTVARQLSFAIGEDVLYGNWQDLINLRYVPAGGYKCSNGGRSQSGPWYQECKLPGEWTGSTQVLRQYLGLLPGGAERGTTKVQFGQCFVFAGVLATVGRSLGIPTRVVTGFNVAHDTNNDRAISLYFNINSKDIWKQTKSNPRPGSQPYGGEGDSTWVFHVWNEMWMPRPDHAGRGLPDADGWQVVDATPQEWSHGVRACGPAPLKYIAARGGRGTLGVDGCYDNEFVMTEVNADVMLFGRKGTRGPYSPSGVASDGTPDRWRFDFFDKERQLPYGVLLATASPRCTAQPGGVALHHNSHNSLECLDQRQGIYKPGAVVIVKAMFKKGYVFPEYSTPPGPATPPGSRPRCPNIHTGAEEPTLSLLQTAAGLAGKGHNDDKKLKEGGGETPKQQRQSSLLRPAAVGGNARTPTSVATTSKLQDSEAAAAVAASFARLRNLKMSDDIQITFQFPAPGEARAGGKCTFGVQVANKGTKKVRVAVDLSGWPISYTGRAVDNAKSASKLKTLELEPGAAASAVSVDIQLDKNFMESMGNALNDGYLQLVAAVEDVETGAQTEQQRRVRVRKRLKLKQVAQAVIAAKRLMKTPQT